MVFHYNNMAGFLMLPVKCEECDSSRSPNEPKVTPTYIGNWKEQNIQPRGKRKCKFFLKVQCTVPHPY
jgi:hypothetical protein